MASARTKLIVGATAGLLAAGYLVFAGLSSGWTYYLDVDAALNAHLDPGHRVRIRGSVGPDPTVDRLDLHAAFTLVGRTGSIDVDYRGPLPETFAAGRDVVVEGSFVGPTKVRADALMTKCSSKYEPRHDRALQTSEAHP